MKKKEPKIESLGSSPVIFNAKDYEDRQKLNEDVRAKVGDNATLNRSNLHKIVGKKEDLDRLFLSASAYIYGVRVVLE